MTDKNEQSFLLPSLADIVFVSLFLVLLFSFGDTLLSDGDTGYHIRAGEHIVDTHSVPKHDLYSWHQPTLPWTAHEWLAEVFMAWTHRAAGLAGVVVFYSLLIALLYAYLFRALLAQEKNIGGALAVTLLAAGSSMLHWLARPHIISLLFIVIFYFSLEAYDSGRRSRLTLLPLLLIPWVNVHGGFIVAFGFFGIYLLKYLALLAAAHPAERSLYRQKAQYLAVLTAVSSLAATLNPHGYKIFLFPFRLTSNRFLMDHVNEFLSPDFHKPMLFTAYALVLFLLLGIAGKRPKPVQLILAALFLYMSLYSIRYIPLFSIIAAPLLLQLLADTSWRPLRALIEEGRRRSEGLLLIDARAKGHLWPLLAVLLASTIAFSGTLDFRFDEETTPAAAVDFLLEERIDGRMFNSDGFGDYLIYQASSEYKVFFDGRSDMYGEALLRDYLRVVQIEPEVDEVLARHDISWVFFHAGSALSRYLTEKKEWHLIYSDGVADIFLRDLPAHRELIAKYAGTLPSSGNDGPAGSGRSGAR